VDENGELVWEMNFPNTENITYGVYRMERFRFSPIISSFPDIHLASKDEVKICWQTCYNFRSKVHVNGSYILYLDGELIHRGKHIFDKFWRPTNISINLGEIKPGTR
jgi:hypothetical protein